MTVQADENRVLLDITGWFTQVTVNRLNKALAMIDLKIRKGFDVKTGDSSWLVEDRVGQIAPFKNAELIDLTRPHGAALYPQE